jgi:deoxyribonuclease-4
MSVAGGLPRAVERAIAHRCDAFQIFAKNANQWQGRPLLHAEIREFRAKVKAARIGPVVSHARYMINLATEPRTPSTVDGRDGEQPDRAEALVCSAWCCIRLLHAGQRGCRADAHRGGRPARPAAHRRRGRTMILPSITAGQGTALGATFEQLASIIAK